MPAAAGLLGIGRFPGVVDAEGDEGIAPVAEHGAVPGPVAAVVMAAPVVLLIAGPIGGIAQLGPGDGQHVLPELAGQGDVLALPLPAFQGFGPLGLVVGLLGLRRRRRRGSGCGRCRGIRRGRCRGIGDGSRRGIGGRGLRGVGCRRRRRVGRGRRRRIGCRGLRGIGGGGLRGRRFLPVGADQGDGHGKQHQHRQQKGQQPFHPIHLPRHENWQ